MVVLIREENTSGKHRRCDARCYNAKGHKCKCICHAANHGIGLEAATKNTEKVIEAVCNKIENPVQVVML